LCIWHVASAGFWDEYTATLRISHIQCTILPCFASLCSNAGSFGCRTAIRHTAATVRAAHCGISAHTGSGRQGLCLNRISPYLNTCARVRLGLQSWTLDVLLCKPVVVILQAAAWAMTVQNGLIVIQLQFGGQTVHPQSSKGKLADMYASTIACRSMVLSAARDADRAGGRADRKVKSASHCVYVRVCCVWWGSQELTGRIT
jgi:hypothetical protein